MDPKIFVPHQPSLFHSILVKEALKMYKEFSFETLDTVYRRIQLGISMTSEEGKSYPGCIRAEKKFLLIPPGLRQKVMEAIHGLNCGVEQWKKEHYMMLGQHVDKCIFYWRRDGTIDTVKTVEQFFMNSNINIRNRFYLACWYCCEERIHALWAEMNSTGQTENLQITVLWMVRFWVSRLRNESRVPWKKAIQDLIENFHLGIKFHSFFPSLLPEEREMFLHKLFFASPDDLRLCLYTMTKEEEFKILNVCSVNVLVSYLQWPLRYLFFETLGKMWKYIDVRSYCNFLHCLLDSDINREIFDFHGFFECFWNCSPGHLRERAKEFPVLREGIESCFSIIKRKRKALFDELEIQKSKK